MEKRKYTKKQKNVFIITLLILVSLIGGITYAYFRAQASSAEQQITTNNMSLDVTPKSDVQLSSDLVPIDEEEVQTLGARQEFTVTNNSDNKLYIRLGLNINQIDSSLDTFDLRWKLYMSYKGDEELVADGSFAFASTSKELVLTRNQYFDASESITYILYIWINETGEDQSVMMNKTLKAQFVATGSLTEEKYDFDTGDLGRTILGNNNSNVITTSPTFSTSSTDKGLYVQQGDPNKSEDGFPTYYYRGAVTNNYVRFANHLWRIVRINEDNSIRIITEDSLGIAPYDESRDCVDAISCNLNYLSSDLHTILTNWYSSNITKASDINKLVYGDFNNDTSFGAITRLKTNKSPSFAHSTFNDIVGILSADEAMFAGILFQEVMPSNKSYLVNNTNFWTITASAEQEIIVYRPDTGLYGHGDIYGKGDIQYRPVVNLRPDIKVVQGNGTVSNPYVVDY